MSFLNHIEKIGLFMGSACRQSEEISSNIDYLRTSTYNFFTSFPQKLWKIALLSLTLSIVLSLAGLTACSGSKNATRPEQRSSSADKGLNGSGPESVKKKLGEPTTISRTPDGHILWIYEPSWKLMPNEKGTVYVEFENEKVMKVFKIR